VTGWVGEPRRAPCGYFTGLTAVFEGALLEGVSAAITGSLVDRGVRHFGTEYFRPLCPSCGLCLPLRVRADRFIPSSSQRRILKKGLRFTAALEDPVPSGDAFRLYRDHKTRFPGDAEEDISYESFVRTFFTPTEGHRILTLRQEGRLILVSHLDFLPRALSAVYCYYDLEFLPFSPGTLAILLELELARRLGLSHLYLGYWISGHPHMDYKIRFYPNQLLLAGDSWYDYRDNGGGLVLDPGVPLRFHPETPLKKYFSFKE
jgi:leucyl-tRNA---protein transferase